MLEAQNTIQQIILTLIPVASTHKSSQHCNNLLFFSLWNVMMIFIGHVGPPSQLQSEKWTAEL